MGQPRSESYQNKFPGVGIELLDQRRPNRSKEGTPIGKPRNTRRGLRSIGAIDERRRKRSEKRNLARREHRRTRQRGAPSAPNGGQALQDQPETCMKCRVDQHK